MLAPITVLLGALVATGNPVLELRYDPSGNNGPQSLLVYPPAGDENGTLGGPITSDPNFFKIGGGKPTRFVFLADHDGDGRDSVVLVRERATKPSHDLQLRIYPPPLFLGGDVGKPVATAKKKTLGSFIGDDRILAIGGADVDGNGKDEAIVVRASAGGDQHLEIRKLPKKKDKGMSKVLASDETFGLIGDGEVVTVMGADIDGDEHDEIVTLIRPILGPDRLLIHAPPSTVAAEVGDPIASVLDLTAKDGAETRAIGRIDFDDGGGPDELALLRFEALSGWRLEIVPFPTALDAQLGAPLFVDANLVGPTEDHVPLGFFGLRGYQPAPPPPPPATLTGSYQIEMSHLVDGTPEELPVQDVVSGISSGGNLFTLNFPVFNPVNGTYSQPNATVDFSVVTAQIDDPMSGAFYGVNLGVAEVTLEGGLVVISGSYSGTKTVGFATPQTVTDGTYRFTRVQ